IHAGRRGRKLESGTLWIRCIHRGDVEAKPERWIELRAQSHLRRDHKIRVPIEMNGASTEAENDGIPGGVAVRRVVVEASDVVVHLRGRRTERLRIRPCE